MKKRIIILLLLSVITVAAVVIYWKHSKNKTDLHLVTVSPQYGYIASAVTATGTIQPVDTVIVGAQVSGVVKAVYTDYNNFVKQGQLLAKVDPSIIVAQIDEAKAILANANSNLEYQRQNLHRQEQLYNLGAISKAYYQISINQFASAEAAVNNASAQLRLSKRNLYYTNIYSPINGVVLNKNVSAGQTIASSFSAPTLFVIAKDLSKIQVKADVDEADIGAVRQNQRVTFTVDAFPDEVFYGSVQKIYLHASISANVVTYSTLINIDNREMKLRPGMTASVTIYTHEDSSALLIPTKALTFNPNSVDLKKLKLVIVSDSNVRKNRLESSGKKIVSVWIRHGDTLTARKIIIGLNDGTSVQVLSDLAPNEELVTDVDNDTKQKQARTQLSPFLPRMQQRPAPGGQPQKNK